MRISKTLRRADGTAALMPVPAPVPDDAAVRVTDGPAQVVHVAPERFDRVAVEFADVIQEQTACYAQARWGEDRLETVVIERRGEIIAAAAVVMIRVPGFGRGAAIVKWGPLWRRRGALPEPGRLESALAALKHEYVERRGFCLTVMPHADPDWSADTLASLVAHGFREGASLKAPNRYLVNVAVDAEAVRQSLGQKWRYNLKKAERGALDIEVVENEGGLERFMALYRQMLARKRFQDTSAIDTLPDLMQAQVAAIRPMIVMVRHDGTDTAGAVIDTSGERAVYLYGATDERALALRAGYVLHWWIAERLIAMEQVRWYDLGGDDDDPGLQQFKKGFVGKLGITETTPPDHHCCGSAASRMLGRSIFGLRDLVAVARDVAHRLGIH